MECGRSQLIEVVDQSTIVYMQVYVYIYFYYVPLRTPTTVGATKKLKNLIYKWDWIYWRPGIALDHVRALGSIRETKTKN